MRGRSTQSLGGLSVPSRVVFELPKFDTGRYSGSEYVMRGGDSHLTIHVTGSADISIVFPRTRWHRFTALHVCPAEWIKEAYFRLVEVAPTESLAVFLSSDSRSREAYRELHHYRIFLDETGCHEVYSESFQTS
jgi:hypothetical protein